MLLHDKGAGVKDRKQGWKLATIHCTDVEVCAKKEVIAPKRLILTL